MEQQSTALLDFERLEVYRLARQLVRATHGLIRLIPSGHADLIDQLRRASLSVTLNLAEGAGEFSTKEKARLYRMAKRSCTEVAAVLNHMVDLQLVSVGETAPAKELARRVTGGIVRLIQATERTSR